MNCKSMERGAAAAMSIVMCAGLMTMIGCMKCEKGKEIDSLWTYHGSDCKTKVITIEDHKYILMNGYGCGTIIHAESCPCKKCF